jgi:hypothetical protein
MNPGSTLGLRDVVTGLLASPELVVLAADDSDAPLLEVADGDATVHPLIASTSAALASLLANRSVLPPRSSTRSAYLAALRPDHGQVMLVCANVRE